MKNHRRIGMPSLCALSTCLFASSLALAGGSPNGPDVIVSTVGGTLQLWGTVGDIAAYSYTTVSCNLGEDDAIWIDSTSLSNPLRNQHPVIGNTLFRLKDGRFEQIGLGWLKHGFCAADAPSCGSPYEPNGSCDWLGTFATDTYSASLNGGQSGLGPRSEVNAWTGEYPYPYVLNWNATGNAIFKRMQVGLDDINPALNAGAQYFGEVQYVCTDEQPINRYNNVSYRKITVGAASGSAWTMSFTGSTYTQVPAINAWKAADGYVVLTNIDVPSDGRMILGYRVTPISGGWHYEYALYNMNSDRSAQSFSVPVNQAIALSNVGFHDVSYHSGEPYSSLDWAPVRDSVGEKWASETFAENANANALRWGTLYNFRFDSPFPPKYANASVGLFKQVDVINELPVRVLAPTNCSADIAPDGIGDGTVGVADLLTVITNWGACVSATDCPADIAPPGGNGVVDVADLLAIINGWGSCP